MRFGLPWAKKKHYHPDPTLFKYGVCSGCGHLILMGQVRNKVVIVGNKSTGITITHNETYGESCAPPWDAKEIGADGEVRYYKAGVKIEGRV
uniref:Uncharacterized protein n=1 Tax=viral metagenome TaxID=1070528 RepID=A0A6M3XU32_9ZZZZ